MERIENYILNNIKRGKAAFTVGVFCRIIKGREILLRKRKEKHSIINKDLSGKYELIGGGVLLEDIGEDYKPLTARLEQEIKEEAGINVALGRVIWVALPTTILTLQKGIIDLALLTDIDFWEDEITPKYEEMIKNGELIWINRDQTDVPIIGKRMEAMIKYPLNLLCNHDWKYEQWLDPEDPREIWRIECSKCGRIRKEIL